MFDILRTEFVLVPRPGRYFGPTMLAAVLTVACNGAPSQPAERVGAPLAVMPEPPADSGAGAPGDGAPDGDANPPNPRNAGRNGDTPRSADAGPRRRQPAKALAAARDADRAAASGDLELAERGYAKAVQLDPQSPWMRTARAWFLARLDRQSDARRELELALDRAERSDPWLIAAIHHEQGLQRESQRDRARARESFRAALRAWSSPPLARVLLRVTPREDLQFQTALRLAFGDTELPPQVLRALGPGGIARPEPLAVASAAGQTAIVTSRPPPNTRGPLPAGAHYSVRVIGPAGQRDAGAVPTVRQLALVEAPALRWHSASVEPVALRDNLMGFLIVLERTAPGAGAPLEVGTTLVGSNNDGALSVLFTGVTGSERDDPLGCRRGWREEVELRDDDGDGAPDIVQLTRSDYTRPRLPRAEATCVRHERTRPPRHQRLLFDGAAPMIEVDADQMPEPEATPPLDAAPPPDAAALESNIE